MRPPLLALTIALAVMTGAGADATEAQPALPPGLSFFDGLDGAPPPPPGSWGHMHRQAAAGRDWVVGTTTRSGHVLAVGCTDDGRHSVTIGPIPERGAEMSGRIAVHGRAGVLFDEAQMFSRVEHVYLTGSVGEGLVEALRAGATAHVQVPDAGLDAEFGLQDSASSIASLSCAPRHGMALPWGNQRILVNADWRVRQDIRQREPPVPVAAPGTNAMMFARPLLSCDRRLILEGLRRAQDEVQVSLTIDQAGDRAADIVMHRRGGRLVSDPLPPAVIDALSTGRVMQLTAPTDADRTDAYSQAFDLDGLGAVLADLSCPPPPPPRAETARIDLTEADLAWRAIDIAPSLQPVATAPVPAAWLDVGAQVPGLYVGCPGVPFFQASPFQMLGDITVELTIDGDPDRRFADRFAIYRTWRRSSGNLDGIGPLLRQGQSLRIVVQENPAIDVLYPLAGLAETLDGLDCTVPAADPWPDEAAGPATTIGASAAVAGGPAWQTIDIAGTLGPGIVGPVPTASLTMGRGMPDLYVGCRGIPFFHIDAFDVAGDVTLELTLDDDPTRRFTGTYTVYQMWRNPGPGVADIGPALREGERLRVVVVETPEIAWTYPLDGLAETLDTMGCTGG